MSSGNPQDRGRGVGRGEAGRADVRSLNEDPRPCMRSRSRSRNGPEVLRQTTGEEYGGIPGRVPHRHPTEWGHERGGAWRKSVYPVERNRGWAGSGDRGGGRGGDRDGEPAGAKRYGGPMDGSLRGPAEYGGDISALKRKSEGPHQQDKTMGSRPSIGGNMPPEGIVERSHREFQVGTSPPLSRSQLPTSQDAARNGETDHKQAVVPLRGRRFLPVACLGFWPDEPGNGRRGRGEGGLTPDESEALLQRIGDLGR